MKQNFHFFLLHRYCSQNVLLTNKSPNNCVVLKTAGDPVFLIENFVENEDGAFIVGRSFEEWGDFFDFPLPSREIGTFQVRELSKDLQGLSVDAIRGKGMKISLKNGLFCVSSL